MTEKIIVIPREVRGYGNIVDKKELADYDGYSSSLTESTATVFGKDMTVYTMEAVGYRLSLALSSSSVTYSTNVTCTATLTDIESGAVSGASIKFYVDNVLATTRTTDSGGVATYNLGQYSSVGTHTIRVVYTTETEDITATATLTVTKRASTLTINTPALVYSDEFDVTGTLKHTNNTQAIIGATVTLHWKVGSGSEQTATATTDSNGAVTFHRSAPTSITDYKFWMTYEGSSLTNGSSSSEITVTVDKETSVLNVTSPASGANLTVGSNISVVGTLLDNDGQVLYPTSPSMVFMTVSYYQGGSYLGYVGNCPVEDDGSFSWSLSNPFSAGSGKIVVSFTGSDVYTAVSTEINVTIGSSYDSIVVTADKNILSAADNEKATLYAQLKKNGSNHSQAGVTITFYEGPDGQGSLGTAQTNSSGLATLTNGYTSTGVGDVGITAGDGTLVSETYAIEDCTYYDPMTSDSGKFTLSGGTATISYGDTGCTFTGTQNTNIFYLYNGTLPTDYILECDIVSMSNTSNPTGYTAGIFVNNASIIQSNNQCNILTTNGATTSNTPLAPYHLKVKVEDTKITVYYEDTVLTTQTLTRTSCGLIGYNYRRCVVKNFKIKPL